MNILLTGGSGFIGKNLNESMHYVLENINEELDLNKLKEINKICLFSLHKGAGKFKKAQNKIFWKS